MNIYSINPFIRKLITLLSRKINQSNHISTLDKLFWLYTTLPEYDFVQSSLWDSHLEPYGLGRRGHVWFRLLNGLYGTGSSVYSQMDSPKLLAILINARKRLHKVVFSNQEGKEEFLRQFLFWLPRRHVELCEKFYDVDLAVRGLLFQNRNSLGKIHILKSQRVWPYQFDERLKCHLRRKVIFSERELIELYLEINLIFMFFVFEILEGSNPYGYGHNGVDSGFTHINNVYAKNREKFGPSCYRFNSWARY